MLRDPAGHAFSDLQPDVTDLTRVRKLRGAQDDFAGRLFEQINQTCVAVCDAEDKPDQLVEHFLQRHGRTDDPADAVEQRITYKIDILAHRGDISVHSHPEKGPRVTRAMRRWGGQITFSHSRQSQEASLNSRTIARLIPIGGNPRKGRHSLNLRVMLASRNQTRSLHSCRKDEVI